MKILLTGGAGYIGSHTAVELCESGCDILIADNLSNSSFEAVKRIKELTGKEFPFYEIDLTDAQKTDALFAENEIDAVIHFAGLKAVGESVTQPMRYYRNNIVSTLSILEAMKKHGVGKLVFSSSATVYGNPEKVPLTEDMPTSCTNPYGWTKLMIEQILRDCAKADGGFSFVLLRYFNPVGAHESGRIGESPSGIPNNLMPYISQVAVGKLEKLSVFGSDYPTPDGSGVRDYIHVVDLAKGHVAAIDYMEKNASGVFTFNLGTGKGYSVLDMVKAFETASGVKVPYVLAPRRPGDIAECYADPKKANGELGWAAEKTLLDMCRDTWRWQKQNPRGY